MMVNNGNSSNLIDGRGEAVTALGGKATIKAFKALALRPNDCANLSHLGMNEIVALAKSIKGDSAAGLYLPIEDVRRAVKLIREAASDRPVELVVQLGPNMLTRWHIVSGGYLINITGGVAALVGRKLVERDRRSWVNWRNGYEDLRYHVAEAVGVDLALHII